MPRTTEKTVQQCQQALAQVEHNILLEKQCLRKEDTAKKKNLGRFFLLAGIGRYFPGNTLPFHEVIQLGALLIVTNLHLERRSCVLGALAVTCEECQSTEHYQAIEKLGEQFFSGNKTLKGPMALALGVALKTKQRLKESDDKTVWQAKGETIFAAQTEKKLAERKRLALKKIGIELTDEGEKA